MKEDWTKQMKQKLEGHQMTPPAGLWESISSEMGLQTAPVVAPKTAVIRRWYWAAAAAILALVGFFALFDLDAEQPQMAAHQTPTENKQTNTPPDSSKPTLMAGQYMPVAKKPMPAASKAMPTASKPTLLAQAPMATQQQAPTVSTEEGPTAPDEDAPTYQPQADAPTIASTTEKQTSLPEVVHPDVTSTMPDDASKWSIGLTGSNGLLLAANSFSHAGREPMLYADFPNDPQAYTNSINKYYQNQIVQSQKETVAKHHIPVRIGLSLQYQLSDRLSLLCGVNYTYMESEFSEKISANRGYTQKLSYLGVPVGLSWKLWSSKNFNIYLAGGTMLEKCVRASLSEGCTDARPWQWSLNAAAGAEYNISRHFGVYLEPSLGYYFDDGTSLQHYYKEHQLAPAIQFGLRLHLK